MCWSAMRDFVPPWLKCPRQICKKMRLVEELSSCFPFPCNQNKKKKRAGGRRYTVHINAYIFGSDMMPISFTHSPVTCHHISLLTSPSREWPISSFPCFLLISLSSSPFLEFVFDSLSLSKKKSILYLPFKVGRFWSPLPISWRIALISIYHKIIG